ncbi:phosphoribosyltransferase family protein [Dactylosporangium sp. CA-139066]|uniref:phosphoribosyltransferase family protein n=1 Tax=Dactylosporangium sp. CA-139066 TaxID=3239930 RepID=UPI003D93DD1F
MHFTDRMEAGRRLAGWLGEEAAADAVVVGVPGGGIPVAIEVAAALRAPLETLVVQRIGVPFQPERAMGALGPGGVLAVNLPVLRAAWVDADELAAEVSHAEPGTADRARHLNARREALELRGHTAIVVDDTMVTGATARAACRTARDAGAARVVVAVPVAASAALASLAGAADRVIRLEAIPDGASAGGRYADFRPVPDDETMRLLTGARWARPAAGGIADPPEEHGRLTVPAGAFGAVVLAHTSLGAEHGPRYRWIAGRLRDAGLATLSLNLLEPDEELDWRAAHDVERLAGRLDAGLRRLRADVAAGRLPVGVFATGSAAAAALAAAAGPARGTIAAVVSHDGRPDLAGSALPRVAARTLLVAGGRDEHLLELNRAAHGRLPAGARLAVLRGAGRQLQEPGALDTLTRLAAGWFAGRLADR